jgi:hypothetical protein
MAPQSSLADLLRRHDRDRYLCALFTPEDRRAAVIALYAFNYEIAKTREVVSEPLLGRIRLQWWREAIAEAYGGATAREHEVMTPLASAIRQYRLSREHFDAMIDAREMDLDDAPPASMAALDDDCSGSSWRSWRPEARTRRRRRARSASPIPWSVSSARFRSTRGRGEASYRPTSWRKSGSTWRVCSSSSHRLH